VIADPAHIKQLDRSAKVSAARNQSFRARLPTQVFGKIPTLERFRGQMLLFMDGDDHIELRAKIATLLKHRPMAARAAIADGWIDAWRRADWSTEVELVRTVITPAVTKSMCLLLNCPPSIGASMCAWSTAFNGSMSGSAGAEEFLSAESAIVEVGTILDKSDDEEWVKQFFSASASPFSQEERQQTLLLLFFAGMDTSLSMISNGMNLLIQSRRGPPESSKSSGVLGELVRQVTPVKFTMREVIDAFVFEGCHFAKGDRVLFSWFGANSSHQHQNNHPSKEDFSFGVGRHSCLGKHVALCQLEACVAGWRNLGFTITLVEPAIFNTNACFHYPQALLLPQGQG
jgi:cytochrome P450